MLRTTLVVLAVVAFRDRYLIVEERDGTFYLPAGRVDDGEDLLTAAARETAEEAGVDVRFDGLLGFEHEWQALPPHARMRFVFAGRQPSAPAPKRQSDHHSRGALWLTREQVTRLPLRHPEVVTWIDRYEHARCLLPCDAYFADPTSAARLSRGRSG